MKTCIPCGSTEPDAAPTCSACGEATFKLAEQSPQLSLPPAPRQRPPAQPRPTNPSRDPRGQ